MVKIVFLKEKGYGLFKGEGYAFPGTFTKGKFDFNLTFQVSTPFYL
jgi:hypothetical protein